MNKLKLTADVIISFEDNECHRYVLLEKNKKLWSILSANLIDGNTFENTAYDKVYKELGFNMKKNTLCFMNIYDNPERDLTNRSIAGVYFHFMDDLDLIKKISEKSNIKWFRINNLPELILDHKKIIEDFMEQQYFEPEN